MRGLLRPSWHLFFPLGLWLASSVHAQDWRELESLQFVPGPLPVLTPSARASVQRDLLSELPAREAPEPGVSPEELATLLQSVESTLDEITAEEARDGENGIGLVDPLERLGGLYLELGEYLTAIVAFERALQIERRHHGLYTLAQTEIVAELAESYAAIGDQAESDSLQRYLVELTRRHPDDPRVPSILVEVADQKMDTVDRLLENGMPPELRITLSDPWTPSVAVPNRSLLLATLNSARFHYGSAIRASLRTGNANLAGLLELQDTIIDTYYLQASHPKTLPAARGNLRGDHQRRSPLFGPGRRILGARVRNIADNGGTPVAVAEALVALGDWHLFFSRNASAFEIYRAAGDMLAEANIDPETIAALLAPDRPPQLPTDSRSLTLSDQTQVRGHFDVAIEIDRYGHGKLIDVLDRSPNATKPVERRLRREIASGRFRPRLENGEFARSYEFAARYDFSY